MTKKTKPYREIRANRLSDPEVAAAYLRATMQDSPDSFLNALKNVAQARKMATVAKDAGVQRETLYRSLSEQGNPTWDTLVSVLTAVGVRLDFLPVTTTTTTVSGNPVPSIAPLVVVAQKPVESFEERQDVALLGSSHNGNDGFGPLQGSIQTFHNSFFPSGALA